MVAINVYLIPYQLYFLYIFKTLSNCSYLTLACRQKGLKVGGRGGGVPPEHGAVREVLQGAVGGCDVGEQHELLHHAHGLQLLLGHDVRHGIRVGINMELHLHACQNKGTEGDKRIIKVKPFASNSDAKKNSFFRIVFFFLRRKQVFFLNCFFYRFLFLFF